MRNKGNTRKAGAWTKFRLLMWKNFLQQWRHPIQTVVELLLPVLTMALILVLRVQIEPEYMDEVRFTPVSVQSLSNNSLAILTRMNITEMSIAYSPQSDVLKDVLVDAISDMLLINTTYVIEFIREVNNTLLPNLNITIPELPDLNITLPPDFNPPDWENANLTIISEILRAIIDRRVQGYDSSDDLRSIYAYEETTRFVLAAVEFDDSLLGATELPSKIGYALRFPERPRLNALVGIGRGRSWRTNMLFPTFIMPGPRDPSEPDGGTDPGYFGEMFIALQHAISTQLVSKITGEPMPPFDINLQRFPHPSYLDDGAVQMLQFIFPMFLLLSFSYAAVNIVRALTVEKELQLKETLKIMGMPTWLHWITWFCKQFIYLLVAVVLIMILLKVNWFTNEYGLKYGIFSNTPWTVLLLFLVLYVACIIFFCFMVSGFFSKASTAALFTGVFWYLTYVPAFLLTVDIEMSILVQFITCLSINSAMTYGIQLLVSQESTGGMHWSDFFEAPATDSSRLLFGHVIIMMILNCVLYMLIALYLEQILPGPYGTPKRWYFLFQKDFWCSGNRSVEDVVLDIPKTPDVTKEMDPMNHAAGVKITNLTKVFGKNVAVNNLSLNIYDDQITVLLGHNGAGKSTTISMLTGNLQATRGSVWVAGHDLTWNTNEARAHIGLCLQHNVLFNDLTVREHLEFFTRLKGFQGQELYDEIDKLIEKLELQEKRDYRAKGLSGGQKRRLCVGIALCGDARVVLLDEPTSGMDPSSRRALWDLLLKEKKGRSMILTTHFMDEADILGDRIAIMSSGQLKCVGSPYFLKKHYGVGYSLVVVKNDGFQLEACTQILTKHIPEVTLKEDRGSEVVYSLFNAKSQVFEVMLNDLEQNVEQVNFKNYGLIATTLEDVFMSVGSDIVSPSGETEFPDVATDSSDVPSRYEFDSTSMDSLRTEKPARGIKLIGQHWLAVWLKLWLVWLRSWPIVLLQLLVPVLIMTAVFGTMNYVTGLAPTINRRALDLTEGYTSTETLLKYDGDNMTSLGAQAMRAYEDIFQTAGIPTMTVSVVEEPIDEYYLQKTGDMVSMNRLRHRWLTGATFSDAGATAWFSNFGYHDIAASLAAVHSALLRARHPTAEIHVYNHPLQVQYEDQTDIQMMMVFLTMQLASGMGSCLCVVSAVFIMFYVKERMIRAKLLQQAAGIKPVVLWSSSAVFDWLWFMVICIPLIIICLAFSVVGLSTFHELGRLYLLLMVFGASMLPFNYIFSRFFKGPAQGFVVVFFINMIFGGMGAQIVESLASPALGTSSDVAGIIDNVLLFFPLYSFISGVRSLSRIGMTRFTCMRFCDFFPSSSECNMEVMCGHLPDLCCIGENPYFEWAEPGVMRYIVSMLGTCVVLWAILMLIEYNVWQRNFRRERQPPPLDDSAEDPDVRDEARHVQALDASAGGLSTHSLVARALTKYYGKHLAVNQISFSVSDGECFGLLGVNGAGKTTTFKMLMGDESISCGGAYVGGYSVSKDINKVHKNIGYCPQFDALFGELTGRETLRLYSLLRGFSAQHTVATTALLADALGFTKHLDKQVNQYSGGNKRKLSTAVSLMGNTRLVFVDEPTTGVDPAAKRQVWRAIRNATRSGRGVVLTSHSMEECEALCSRLTVMVNGRFRCLGSPQHLKNKYSQGFTLTIKMKMERDQPSNSTTLQPIEAVKHYVESNFTNTKLMEEYQGLLTYYVSDRGIAWSRMFGIMERAKLELPVEDYSISQTSLEQIFLQFTKYQQ